MGNKQGLNGFNNFNKVLEGMDRLFRAIERKGTYEKVNHLNQIGRELFKRFKDIGVEGIKLYEEGKVVLVYGARYLTGVSMVKVESKDGKVIKIEVYKRGLESGSAIRKLELTPRIGYDVSSLNRMPNGTNDLLERVEHNII